MTQEEITNDNKLIAEFMGKRFYGHPIDKFGPEFNTEYPVMQYHFNWSWLMPVVEKICRTKVGDGIEYVDYCYPRTFGMINEDTGKIMVRLNGHGLFEADTLIEAAWFAVVEFIKFNKSKNI